MALLTLLISLKGSTDWGREVNEFRQAARDIQDRAIVGKLIQTTAQHTLPGFMTRGTRLV